MIFPTLIIVISMAMIPLAEYLAFPSRYNVFFWFSFPLAVITLPVGGMLLANSGELGRLIYVEDLWTLAGVLFFYSLVFIGSLRIAYVKNLTFRGSLRFANRLKETNGPMLRLRYSLLMIAGLRVTVSDVIKTVESD